MGYRLNRLDEPVLIAVSKPLLTEFGIHHRLESCGGINSLLKQTEVKNELVARSGVFCRGYFASLATYVPSSASWWAFYHFFQESLYKVRFYREVFIKSFVL